MKRLLIWTACLGLVLTAGVVPSAQARTSVSVGLNFGDRYDGPDLYWRDQPSLAVVPGTDIYYVRNYDYDVYREGRYWYYNSDNRWYRSRNYRGPWIYVGYQSVPSQFSSIPVRYRHHWRDFRDDRYYQTSRTYHRDWRDRRYRDSRDRDMRDRSWRDRNRDNNDNNNDQDMRNRDPRDRNNDGQVDWRDR
jgi:hypothetical protein